MADIIITLKIMPDSPDVNLKEVESQALDKIKSFSGMENYKVEQEPVAFGLKAVKILFVMDEAKGTTDPLEADINKIEGVHSVEVTDVRRAIG